MPQLYCWDLDEDGSYDETCSVWDCEGQIEDACFIGAVI